MDAQTIRHLESSNPKERFTAIKQVARSKDVTALKKLSQIAAEDPDEQIRDVAAKAIAYIKADSRATTAAKKAEIVVTPKDEARAKNFVDSAISYQISGERDKALKELAKALKANPHLEKDPFFKSVLEETTGMMGDDALAMVRNPDEIKAVASSERKQKKERRQEEHLKEVQRSRWASVMMDLAIFAFLSIVLTFFLLALTGQSAQGYLAGVAAAQQAFRNGEIEEAPEIDPVFMETAAQYTNLTIPFSLTVALITGVTGVISLLVNLLFTHIAARFIFGGQATFPHLIYKVVSFYNTRLPILYGIMFLTIVLTFAVGGGIIPFVGSGAISLYSFFLFFNTVGRIGEAYDFGTLKGCLSSIIGSVILGIIQAVVFFLFFSAAFTALMSQQGFM